MIELNIALMIIFLAVKEKEKFQTQASKNCKFFPLSAISLKLLKKKCK